MKEAQNTLQGIIAGLTEWESKRENLKRRFPALSDKDLETGGDGKSGMMGNLATKLGLSSDELDMVIMTS